MMGEEEKDRKENPANGSKDNPMSASRISKEDKVSPEDPAVSEVANSKLYNSDKIAKEGITITPEEKKAFVDAIIGNKRFCSDYSIFGGSIRLTLRSLTTEEAMAVASYCMKNSVVDVSGQVTGKYRKYLIAAHIDKYNGTEFKPLAAPLFGTIGEDGEEKDPEWTNSEDIKFWDRAHPAVVSAVAKCVADFEAKYEYLTSKAEDANFWISDTH